jgi:hypothetical protein
MTDCNKNAHIIQEISGPLSLPDAQMRETRLRPFDEPKAIPQIDVTFFRQFHHGATEKKQPLGTTLTTRLSGGVGDVPPR